LSINISLLCSTNYLLVSISHPFIHVPVMAFLGFTAPGYYGDGLLQKGSVVLSTAKCFKFNPTPVLLCLFHVAI